MLSLESLKTFLVVLIVGVELVLERRQNKKREPEKRKLVVGKGCAKSRRRKKKRHISTVHRNNLSSTKAMPTNSKVQVWNEGPKSSKIKPETEPSKQVTKARRNRMAVTKTPSTGKPAKNKKDQAPQNILLLIRSTPRSSSRDKKSPLMHFCT